jgi:hypothetical protein
MFDNNSLFYTYLIIFFICVYFYKFIKWWRYIHVKKQMRIVRAILYRLSLAPSGTQEEYEFWRNGKLHNINVGPECGPIHETVLSVFDMKRKLGSEASMILLLYFLNLGVVSSVDNEIGTLDLRWARLIGQLPNLYAVTYEKYIMAEFNKTCNKENMLLIMMYLCGPNCLVTTRMFLLWRTGHVSNDIPKPRQTDIPGTDDYHPKIFIQLPRQFTFLPSGFPSRLLLDVEYHCDRMCSTRSEWIEKVRKTRIELWGESGVSVERVLSLVGCSQLDGSRMNCNMGSVLAPLN